MYMPGRRRTASSPSRTWILSAPYSSAAAACFLSAVIRASGSRGDGGAVGRLESQGVDRVLGQGRAQRREEARRVELRELDAERRGRDGDDERPAEPPRGRGAPRPGGVG